MNLCGIGIAHEDIFPEKVTSTRLLNVGFNACTAVSIQFVIPGLIRSVKGILREIKLGNPCDIKGNPIDKITVQRELHILSKCIYYKKLDADQFNLTEKGSLAKLHELSKEMFSLSQKMHLEHSGLLFFMAVNDHHSLIPMLPVELTKEIIHLRQEADECESEWESEWDKERIFANQWINQEFSNLSKMGISNHEPHLYRVTIECCEKILKRPLYTLIDEQISRGQELQDVIVDDREPLSSWLKRELLCHGVRIEVAELLIKGLSVDSMKRPDPYAFIKAGWVIH